MFRDSYGWSMPPITISSNARQRTYSGNQLHSRHQRDWDPPQLIQRPNGFKTPIMDALDQLAHMKKLHISFTDIRPGFVATPLLKDDKYPLLMHASQRGISNCKSHLPKEKSSCHRPALSDAGVFLETDSRMAMGEAARAEPIILQPISFHKKASCSHPELVKDLHHRLALSVYRILLEIDSRMVMGEAACAEPIIPSQYHFIRKTPCSHLELVKDL